MWITSLFSKIANIPSLWKKISLAVIAVVVMIYIGAGIYWGIISIQVKRDALKNPATRETVYVDRYIDRIITKNAKGEPVIKETVREVEKKTAESTPLIPTSETRHKSFYLSGGIGTEIDAIKPIYTVGGGIIMLDSITLGPRVVLDNGRASVYVELSVLF